MRHQQIKELFSALILIVILMTIFPIAAKKVFESILIGVIIGVIAMAVVIAVWFFLEYR